MLGRCVDGMLLGPMLGCNGVATATCGGAAPVVAGGTPVGGNVNGDTTAAGGA